jgi:hypothetical protein
MLSEVGGFSARYLCGDAQRHLSGACDADGIFRPLLGREAAEKSQV